jgi:hypothetical protein
MKYIYSFVVWPDEQGTFERSLFDYFRIFRHRTEMHFTQSEFERFRKEMLLDGFTLREVSRVTYIEPESVL